MGTVWRYLGIGSALGLVWAGVCRLGEKPPCFAAHLAVCLFLAVQILSHYPTWSGMPEATAYLYSLLGAMALLFYAYYRAAYDVGLPKKHKLLVWGLLAVFLCAVALWDNRFCLIYGGGICWVLTDLNALWNSGEKAV